MEQQAEWVGKELHDLDGFVMLNKLAVTKIAKKFDKVLVEKSLAWAKVRVEMEPLLNVNLGAQLIMLSDVWHAIRRAAPTGEKVDGPADDGAAWVAPTEFKRSTTKYWVLRSRETWPSNSVIRSLRPTETQLSHIPSRHNRNRPQPQVKPENVMALITAVVRELPILVIGRKMLQAQAKEERAFGVEQVQSRCTSVLSRHDRCMHDAHARPSRIPLPSSPPPSSPPIPLPSPVAMRVVGEEMSRDKESITARLRFSFPPNATGDACRLLGKALRMMRRLKRLDLMTATSRSGGSPDSERLLLHLLAVF